MFFNEFAKILVFTTSIGYIFIVYFFIFSVSLFKSNLIKISPIFSAKSPIYSIESFIKIFDSPYNLSLIHI